jgi:ParB family chromosome partitioning protein
MPSDGHDVQPTEAERFIEVDGKRGRLIEALVQFDGEGEARTIRF